VIIEGDVNHGVLTGATEPGDSVTEQAPGKDRKKLG
jgi:hypothetical protein